MSRIPDERTAELRELFFESAQELLQALNDEGLKLEKHPGDLEAVRSIRRAVHTLKGDAAACGYRELSELAHELEDVLGLEPVSSQASVAEVAFTAADMFGAILAAYRGRLKLPSTEPLRKMVRKLADQPAAKSNRKKAAAKSKVVGWSEYERLAIGSALSQGKRVYHVMAHVDPHCAMPIAGQQLVHKALTGLGEVLAARPEPGSSQAAKLLEFLLATDQPAEQVAAKCQVPTIVSKVDVEEITDSAVSSKKTLPKPQPKTEAQLEPVTDPAGAAPALKAFAEEPRSDDEEEAPAKWSAVGTSENILRVDAERIDNVLNLVGELIMGKSMLQQALNELGRRFPKEALRGKFADAMAFQARVLNDLQRSVMKIRMVPVEQLFRRFPRIVRDVARQCGKDVELVVSGQDTDLDKSILDAIAEPLAHLVRNAVSHGIGTAAQRQHLGKPARGIVRLNAYHQGNQVIVEVSDDGRGIDLEKVKAKAVEQGVVKAEEAGRLTEAEVLDLIFRPGFSTAEEVTEVAGRGVGLDVVQSVLHRLKGAVGVETRPGQGTAFRLKLPLTLAIIKALLFRVEQRLYAVPLNTVVEIARTHESEVHQVDNYEVLQLRNQVLPMLRLGRPGVQGSDHYSRKLFVLVITVGERKFGLIVDGLEGEEELVIKALDDQTVSTDLVSGASILGDGRVVLILNISALVEHFARSRPAEAGGVMSGLLLSSSDRARLAAGAAGGQA